mgnify:CR=1 FL=1
MAQKRTDWEEIGTLIRMRMKDDLPPIRIEKVMEVLGYSSKASAEYALYQLAEIGVVQWINGKWYLI